MAQLIPIKIDEQTTIYIEAAENMGAPSLSKGEYEEYDPNAPRGKFTSESGDSAAENIARHFEAIEQTIRLYTGRVLHAFSDAALANVDGVKLEFGVSVSGEAGIPYITKGEVGSNLKITVECSFPKKS